MTPDVHEIGLGDTVDGFIVETLESKRLFHWLYRVSHPDHDLPMIMKVPRLGLTTPSSVISSFETEVRILSRLRGVYTPKFIAKGDLAKRPYLVMEYIEHDDLQQAVTQAPVTAERVCELMIPVCKAVHELHRHNIIHLDIKPGNIKNRPDGKAVVLDFGTAHHSQMPDLYDDPHKKAPRSFPYVAPEQLKDVRTDSRSDLFALGVIMYRLLTGELPFGRGDPLTVKKRLYLLPIPPRALNPEVPPWLQEIILKCLQRLPQQRYASAKQVAYLLSHPQMVTLGKLSELNRKPGLIQNVKSWMRDGSVAAKDDQTVVQPHERISRAAHILVALDIGHCSEDLQRTLQNTLRKLVEQGKHSYITVLTVVDSNELSGREDFTDLIEQESPSHVQRLMELQHWMNQLKFPRSHINYQVLEGNAAKEILSYAKYHVVDHIVLCARGSSTLRRFMGSVSTKVVAEAPCSVTVVRTRLN